MSKSSKIKKPKKNILSKKQFNELKNVEQTLLNIKDMLEKAKEEFNKYQNNSTTENDESIVVSTNKGNE